MPFPIFRVVDLPLTEGILCPNKQGTLDFEKGGSRATVGSDSTTAEGVSSGEYDSLTL